MTQSSHSSISFDNADGLRRINDGHEKEIQQLQRKLSNSDEEFKDLVDRLDQLQQFMNENEILTVLFI